MGSVPGKQDPNPLMKVDMYIAKLSAPHICDCDCVGECHPAMPAATSLRL